MKNIRSTVAMKLAHKIAKQFPKTAFKVALQYAWKMVRIDLTLAKRVLEKGYKVKTVRQETMFGVSYAIQFVKVGFKEALKGLFGKSDTITISRWSAGFTV